MFVFHVHFLKIHWQLTVVVICSLDVLLVFYLRIYEVIWRVMPKTCPSYR